MSGMYMSWVMSGGHSTTGFGSWPPGVRLRFLFLSAYHAFQCPAMHPPAKPPDVQTQRSWTWSLMRRERLRKQSIVGDPDFPTCCPMFNRHLRTRWSVRLAGRYDCPLCMRDPSFPSAALAAISAMRSRLAPTPGVEVEICVMCELN